LDQKSDDAFATTIAPEQPKGPRFGAKATARIGRGEACRAGPQFEQQGDQQLSFRTGESWFAVSLSPPSFAPSGLLVAARFSLALIKIKSPAFDAGL
jgi:hypothetical protein